MKITNALRKRLEILLPHEYRGIVVERLKARGISIHPNTVYNVLHGSDNTEVAVELMKLAREQKSSQKQFKELSKQL